MKLQLVGSVNNQIEKKFITDLSQKIEAVGYETSLFSSSFVRGRSGGGLKSVQAVVMILDGRLLAPLDYLNLGVFLAGKKQSQPEKLLVAYKITSKTSVDNLEKIFDHIASSEYGLIACLKDYLYLSNRHEQKNNRRPKDLDRN